MKKILLVLILAVSLVGCSSSGKITNSSYVSKVAAVGRSKSQVKEALGKPRSVALTNEGQEMWVYMNANVKRNPISYIPVVGVLLGGADTETTTLRITFDENGNVIDYKTDYVEMNTGLLNL
jgi:outer membrane protein assembly factor BamE (lipoprotein component of BamABCDE complex)